MAAMVLLAGNAAPAQRIAFVIATGPTGGTYFPVGEAIASIVSHPPGVYRCETPGVCGPPGLIASVRTSPGAVANVLAVNAHTVDAALAQSDVVADAVAGRGAFRSTGAQKHVRVIANLFPEEVHLLARMASHVRTPADLRGKRVSVGPDASGTIVTAAAVLAAFHVGHIRANKEPSDSAAEKLAKGELDAMFFVGGAPVPMVRELLLSGKAVLVPIGGAGRERLLKQDRALSAAVVPAGLYPKTGKLETVGVHAMFIANDAVPDIAVYALTKSLFNPANRAMLAGSHRSAQSIRLDTAASNLPAPLHPGAARFYKEDGKLPKPAASSGKT
ncbi:MAG: TAXI family TRAP transporter solute-binding subunit [Alphaproteobacteria bacterium]|nr:TAXI family TRAP transporter solute-binding subunit [Alphaproteobacteria bacterium]